jgi:GDPmannose 4,6-dehydratase
MTNALITGISGQDGWYLARRLLGLGYSVVGTTHRRDAAGSIDIEGRAVPMVYVDLGDVAQIEAAVQAHAPDEIYNLGCRSSSAQLFDDPLATADINGVAVARWLEAIVRHRPSAKFCQASSAEVFAGATTTPQSEDTLRVPLNAYGAAKAFGDHLVAAYRTRGVFACSAILYPHESPRRPLHYLVHKVTNAAARKQQVKLGDLSAVRDWGFAPDVVEAMRLMLQAQAPRDYVIATGEGHTVQDVCDAAFAHVDLDWRAYVVVEEGLRRGAEPITRIGDSRRARTDLAWAPSLTFRELIGHLVNSDRAALD